MRPRPHRWFNVCGGVLLAIAMLFASGTDARAGRCLKDDREVKLDKSSVRIGHYLCRTDKGRERAAFSVEFFRLSEALASTVIREAPAPLARELLGTYKIVGNDVLAEVKHLFKEFGTEMDFVPNSSRVILGGTRGGGEVKKEQPNWKISNVAFFDYPGADERRTRSFPLPAVSRRLFRSDQWEKGFNFYYGPCEFYGRAITVVECTTLWRYMRNSDIDAFPSNYKIYVSRWPWTRQTPDQYDLKNLRLIRYLTREGWPEDFITIVGGYEGCGGFVFNYYQRSMNLEIALVRNLSARPLSIDNLIGVQTGSMKLRALSESRRLERARAERLGDAPVTIAPNEVALIPVRISFVPSERQRLDFGNLAAAEGAYRKRIAAARTGTIFKPEPLYGEEIQFAGKRRESFPPPTAPAMNDYIYGPEIALRGLEVNGERLDLDEISANFMALTASAGEGSCPYLYVWNEDERHWHRYGTVIHEANGERRKMTERIPLHRLATRFRLSEEELEVSHIDRAHLVLSLKDGKTLTLRPNNSDLAETDGRAMQMYSGQSVEFEFELPETLDKRQVANSELLVTGYYRSYSSFVSR